MRAVFWKGQVRSLSYAENFLLNATFVPPPAEQVVECMGQLELFLHNKPVKTSVLIKAALAHVQFETIHPFLDGNGRVGRLLITLLLCAEGILKEPMLYLSLYFKSHRKRYYDLLNQTRLTGDWEAWLAFFAQAVSETATKAVETAQTLLQVAAGDRERITAAGRISGSVLRVHQALLERPIASPNWLVKKTGLSQATVNACLEKLQELKVAKEITGQKRNRLYSYQRYIEIMNKGTEQ